MKQVLLLNVTTLLVFASCKKDSTSPTTPPLPSSNQPTTVYIIGDTGTVYHTTATYWKNDTVIYLGNGLPGTAYNMVLSGSDMHLILLLSSEYGKDSSVYWRNGQYTTPPRVVLMRLL